MLAPSPQGCVGAYLGAADGARRARKLVTDNLDNSDNLERKVPSKDHPGSYGRGDPHLTYRPEGRSLWLSWLSRSPSFRQTGIPLISDVGSSP